MQTLPGPHEGLGVENYSWCTSPLRRYVDLVNQWQLIAMAQHGVTAKLVAPFKPKDADLMAIAADFDGTYAAYGEHQNQMERYWCLMHLKQLGLPWKGVVRHLKEGQARVEEIPLRLNVPELSEQARGARAEVEVSDIDFLSLETSVRYLGLIDSGNDMEIVFQGDAEVQSEVSPGQEPTIDQQNSQPDAHPGVSQ
jgi:exoribonuclease-2